MISSELLSCSCQSEVQDSKSTHIKPRLLNCGTRRSFRPTLAHPRSCAQRGIACCSQPLAKGCLPPSANAVGSLLPDAALVPVVTSAEVLRKALHWHEDEQQAIPLSSTSLVCIFPLVTGSRMRYWCSVYHNLPTTALYLFASTSSLRVPPLDVWLSLVHHAPLQLWMWTK